MAQQIFHMVSFNIILIKKLLFKTTQAISGHHKNVNINSSTANPKWEEDSSYFGFSKQHDKDPVLFLAFDREHSLAHSTLLLVFYCAAW